MDQLVLDLTPPPAPAFDHFIAEHNRQIIAALTDSQGERFIYLWGAAGVGKTHLLQQWVEHANAVGRAAIYLDARAEKLPDFAREARCVAVDHVDELEPDDQITLFSIFNSLRDSDGQLLTAGREPPQRLKLRDDLRTRLGWGLVFQVQAMSDADKLAALRRHAQMRLVNVPEDVLRWLITHWRRDMASLVSMVDALDHYSLALQKPITVPLVKHILQTSRQHP
ncbi:DnaA regulatory inactivator Hda [Laribacter hongkongensis]|uniref:DnaA regulatory inactivator Hda n=1 Tax=Laribacter hongkongensis TaxID=168471 RepID=UPI001EFC675B|nr:DnaA regulatory inactivator Hda [Laribacter hongkongensis]MCG9098314.1 DnaA regulatory inactivator Hda [Laribacter hongkongensis]